MKKYKVNNKHVVITVTGKDRPGIVALISNELFKNGCNIEDTRMSILQGEFAMMLIAQLPGQKFQLDRFSKELSALGEKSGLYISVRQCKLDNKLNISSQDQKPTYIVSVIGPDKPGIVSKISDFFGKNNINIVDMKTFISEGEKYSMLLEVDIPNSVKFHNVESELIKIAHQLHVYIDIQHSGIFKAMHRI